VLLEHVAPRMAVCLGGRVERCDDHGAVTLDRGEAGFVDAVGGPLRITGDGRWRWARHPTGAPGRPMTRLGDVHAVIPAGGAGTACGRCRGQRDRSSCST
jgi:hypothetical protein